MCLANRSPGPWVGVPDKVVNKVKSDMGRDESVRIRFSGIPQSPKPPIESEEPDLKSDRAERDEGKILLRCLCIVFCIFYGCYVCHSIGYYSTIYSLGFTRILELNF